MRRTDREMGQEFALMILDQCEWATLATVDADGAPYCIPVTIVREGARIFFHCAQAGQKVENLRARPAVCLTAVGHTHIVQKEFSTEYECAVVRGVAEEITDPAAKIAALRLLCQRHTPAGMDGFDAAIAASLPRTGVWAVSMDAVSAKRKKYDSAGKELKFGAQELI